MKTDGVTYRSKTAPELNFVSLPLNRRSRSAAFFYVHDPVSGRFVFQPVFGLVSVGFSAVVELCAVHFCVGCFHVPQWLSRFHSGLLSHRLALDRHGSLLKYPVRRAAHPKSSYHFRLVLTGNLDAGGLLSGGIAGRPFGLVGLPVASRV